jgi:hypothetical protein
MPDVREFSAGGLQEISGDPVDPFYYWLGLWSTAHYGCSTVMKNNKMGDCRTKPRNVEWLPNCALGKVKSKVREVKECLKTWP